MKPKILFFDIETTPNKGYVWEKHDTDVIAFESYWHLLSFSAKWSGGKQITRGLIDYEGYEHNKNDDRKITLDLWKLFDEADILVAHNGDQFDIKKTTARFAYHKLPPPSPYFSIDTLKLAKRHFNFVSNSLDDLGDMLNLGRKENTGGFKLWKDCMAGDKKAWRLMKKYNAQDVILLEKVYLRFRPYMKTPLVYSSEYCCPKCGSNHIQARGVALSGGMARQRYQCIDCGGWFQGAKGERINYPNKNL